MLLCILPGSARSTVDGGTHHHIHFLLLLLLLHLHPRFSALLCFTTVQLVRFAAILQPNDKFLPGAGQDRSDELQALQLHSGTSPIRGSNGRLIGKSMQG